MKKILLLLLLVNIDKGYSQIGILINPYLDYSGITNPKYTNGLFHDMEYSYLPNGGNPNKARHLWNSS